MSSIPANPPTPDGPGRALAECWWVISGDQLLTAMWKAHMGDHPGVVYAELIANASGPGGAGEHGS